jgi:hypothetical protein
VTSQQKLCTKPGSCKYKCVVLVKRLISKNLDEVEKNSFVTKYTEKGGTVHVAPTQPACQRRNLFESQ